MTSSARPASSDALQDPNGLPERAPEDRRRERQALIGLAVGALALHLAAGDRYGIFRDELYFIVCGWRPAWGYVDQPPAIALIAAGAHAVFGEWVLGLRLLPALASAGTVALTALLARRLGGGAFAMVLSGISVLASPVLLALGHYLTMNTFDVLLWIACAYFLVRLIQTGNRNLWLVIGVLLGLGLLTKYSIAFLAIGALAGLLLTPERRLLWDVRFVAAVAIATVLALPNLIWQAGHGFPMLELLENGRLYKNAPFSLGAFLLAQVQEMQPVNVLIWGAGLGWLLVARPARPYRVVGLAFLAVLAIELAGQAKPYYLAPAFPMLLAAGGVVWERLIRRAWLRGLAAAYLAVSGLVLAPVAVPLLPVEARLAWQQTLGLQPEPLERGEVGPLPQLLADQFGWPETARAVAEVYHALPEADRARAGVFTRNYGEAAALEVHGRALGLPRPMSGHNNYWLWGPTPKRADVLIVISGDEADLRARFRDVRRAGALPDHPMSMPYQRRVPLWVVRGPVEPVEAIWSEVKHYE